MGSIQGQSQEDPLEEGMATQSSVPAWRIPWTEKLMGVAKSWTQWSVHTHMYIIQMHVMFTYMQLNNSAAHLEAVNQPRFN